MEPYYQIEGNSNILLVLKYQLVCMMVSELSLATQIGAVWIETQISSFSFRVSADRRGAQREDRPH